MPSRPYLRQAGSQLGILVHVKILFDHIYNNAIQHSLASVGVVLSAFQMLFWCKKWCSLGFLRLLLLKLTKGTPAYLGQQVIIHKRGKSPGVLMSIRCSFVDALLMTKPCGQSVTRILARRSSLFILRVSAQRTKHMDVCEQIHGFHTDVTLIGNFENTNLFTCLFPCVINLVEFLGMIIVERLLLKGPRLFGCEGWLS